MELKFCTHYNDHPNVKGLVFRSNESDEKVVGCQRGVMRVL